jgi:predicted  nucleic acid-binding Zn-ribbon protein
MEALAALQERLRNHDERLNANHNSISNLRGEVGRQQVEVAVIHKEVANSADDIARLEAKMEKGFERLEEKIDGQFTTWRRTIWSGAGLIIMAGGVLVTLITQHG